MIHSCGEAGYRTYVVVDDPDSWSSDDAENRDFFAKFDAAVMAHTECYFDFGIITSKFFWEQIMGEDYSQYATKRLIYIHADNKASFEDFQKFGGWSSPYGKQYARNIHDCSIMANKVFSPSRIGDIEIDPLDKIPA